MMDYAFGAGGFRLGDRVEVLLTGQRGILISETIHISGCNTYMVLMPSVLTNGRMKVTCRDHLMLRKLDPEESMFDEAKVLTEENSFSPKGVDVNAEWILAAISEQKEHIPEIDDAVGIAEIAILPGTKVWSKVYGKVMIVTHVLRGIYSKELEYGAVHMTEDKEVTTYSFAYELIPLEQGIKVPSSDKKGSLYEDGRDIAMLGSRFLADRYVYY